MVVTQPHTQWTIAKKCILPNIMWLLEISAKDKLNYRYVLTKIQAASASKLELGNELLNRWLSSCDTFNTGRYSISKLVEYLQKGRRSHLLERRRQVIIFWNEEMRFRKCSRIASFFVKEMFRVLFRLSRKIIKINLIKQNV